MQTAIDEISGGEELRQRECRRFRVCSSGIEFLRLKQSREASSIRVIRARPRVIQFGPSDLCMYLRRSLLSHLLWRYFEYSYSLFCNTSLFQEYSSHNLRECAIKSILYLRITRSNGGGRGGGLLNVIHFFKHTLRYQSVRMVWPESS
jgi:hypothetical protein